MAIRREPRTDGPVTTERLLPDEVFLVAEEQPSLEPDGSTIIYLRLSDGRGWAFDSKPGVGVMCIRVSQAAITHRLGSEHQSPPPHEPVWKMGYTRQLPLHMVSDVFHGFSLFAKVSSNLGWTSSNPQVMCRPIRLTRFRCRLPASLAVVAPTPEPKLASAAMSKAGEAVGQRALAPEQEQRRRMS